MSLYRGIYDEVIHVSAEDAGKENLNYLSLLLGSRKTKMEIGSGAYGCVYNNVHEETAVKTGNALDNDGYLTFLKVARANQNNPFFPKIHRATLFKAKTDTRWESFLIEMERLQKGHSKPLWDDIVYCVEDLIYRDKARTIPGIEPVPKALKTAISLIKKAKTRHRYGVDWDIHDDNMMLRPNGQLVITDPLS